MEGFLDNYMIKMGIKTTALHPLVMLKFLWLLVYLLNTAPTPFSGTASYFSFTVRSTNLKKKSALGTAKRDTWICLYFTKRGDCVGTTNEEAHKGSNDSWLKKRPKLVRIKGWELYLEAKSWYWKKKSPEKKVNACFWAFPWLFRVQPDTGDRLEFSNRPRLCFSQTNILVGSGFCCSLILSDISRTEFWSSWNSFQVVDGFFPPINDDIHSPEIKKTPIVPEHVT